AGGCTARNRQDIRTQRDRHSPRRAVERWPCRSRRCSNDRQGVRRYGRYGARGRGRHDRYVDRRVRDRGGAGRHVSLTICELAYLRAEPPDLSETSPATTVWRDGNQPVAYGTTRGDWHWLRVTGAGAYRFPVRASDGVVACGVVPEAGARPEVVV